MRRLIASSTPSAGAFGNGVPESPPVGDATATPWRPPIAPPASAPLAAPFRARWWQWPTICSFDAPLVCLVWQVQLAQVAGVPLDWAPMAVLAMSVWLAYAADRWIEGWRLAPRRTLTPRHRFYQQFRWPVAFAWVLVLAADVSIALLRLDRRELSAGIVLLGLVLTYLLLHQLLHRERRTRAPKEIWVAALLSGGIAVFVVTNPPAAIAPTAVPLALFALLCFANCALISTWEHAVDLIHGTNSLARQFQAGAAISHILPWTIAALSLAGIIGNTGQAATAAACALASSVLLGVVDALEPRFGRQLARVLADAVLLTPIVPLLASRLGA